MTLLLIGIVGLIVIGLIAFIVFRNIDNDSDSLLQSDSIQSEVVGDVPKIPVEAFLLEPAEATSDDLPLTPAGPIHLWFVVNGMTPDGEVIEDTTGPDAIEEFETDYSCRVYLGEL